MDNYVEITRKEYNELMKLKKNMKKNQIKKIYLLLKIKKKK